MNTPTEADTYKSNANMKKIKKITVVTHPNGYELNVGSHSYLYFSQNQLAGGIFQHILLNESNETDADLSACILEAAASWQTIGEALKANAVLMRDIKEQEKDYRKLRKKYSDISEEIEILKEENRRMKEIQNKICEMKILEKGKKNKNIK